MKKFFILVILLAAASLGGFIWWTTSTSPVNSNSKDFVIFVVEKGDGVREIASRLKDQGLIKSPIAFFLLVKQSGLDKQIQAGDFRLYSSMNLQEIAQNLTHGILDIWITVPEGQRATEIAETLKKKIPSYNFSWIYTLNANEGYLFPDTYLIPKDANIEAIVFQMRNNFDLKYSEVNSNNSSLSKSQIVILASLIEREAITDSEKPIIAGVLMNRLNAGMPLQVDATIQYAKGKNQLTNKWWDAVTLEEYKSVKSDYNTYLSTGFPPGPISNPGLQALRAAANPANTDYMYYLHDKNGQIRYAKTLTEHNTNIEKYGLN